MFQKNTQIEIIYISLLGLHHFVGGFAMLYAFLYDSPALFAHAALWELVDDINDLVSMVFLCWPFQELDLRMIVIMGFHHIFGVIIMQILHLSSAVIFLLREEQLGNKSFVHCRGYL